MTVHRYWVYIMSSMWRTTYVGVTNNLERRVHQHKSKCVDGFTKTYDVDRLVWFQEFQDVRLAIATEKRIKGWKRIRKIALIDSINPSWKDLAQSWYARPKA